MRMKKKLEKAVYWNDGDIIQPYSPTYSAEEAIQRISILETEAHSIQWEKEEKLREAREEAEREEWRERREGNEIQEKL
jgi:hypothetical protein